MNIKMNRYAIVTKEKPFEFVMSDLHQTNDIEKAMLNDSEKICNDIIKSFSCPNEYEVMRVEVIYKI
jgi:hypothetical protein